MAAERPEDDELVEGELVGEFASRDECRIGLTRSRGLVRRGWCPPQHTFATLALSKRRPCAIFAIYFLAFSRVFTRL